MKFIPISLKNGDKFGKVSKERGKRQHRRIQHVYLKMLYLRKMPNYIKIDVNVTLIMLLNVVKVNVTKRHNLLITELLLLQDIVFFVCLFGEVSLFIAYFLSLPCAFGENGSEINSVTGLLKRIHINHSHIPFNFSHCCSLQGGIHHRLL